MALVQLLHRLQTVDLEWDEKARRYQFVKQTLVDTSEIDAQRKEHERLVAELSARRSKLRNAELELDSLVQKAREVEEALYSGAVSSPRELDNLRKDSEHLRRRISQLEDDILEGMAVVDDLAAAAQEGQERLEALEAQRARLHTALVQEYKDLRERLQELQETREDVRGQLGQPELTLYDELRKTKAGRALAPLQEGMCQICRVAVPAAKASRAQEGTAIATCEGCGRILFQE